MKSDLQCRYFTSYTGIRLPLRLVNELDGMNVEKRITYFRAYYDSRERLRIIEKVVYGEIEFSHHYEYHDNDLISKAIMVEDDSVPRTMVFDVQGNAVETWPI